MRAATTQFAAAVKPYAKTRTVVIAIVIPLRFRHEKSPAEQKL
jgi:hypothetical protein